MYVPGFGEGSPEARASGNLHNFFNYVAVKIVSAQLQSYNPEAHKDLMEFVDTHSLNDGDKFCASLMRESSRHKALEFARKFSERGGALPYDQSSSGNLEARLCASSSSYWPICQREFAGAWA